MLLFDYWEVGGCSYIFLYYNRFLGAGMAYIRVRSSYPPWSEVGVSGEHSTSSRFLFCLKWLQNMVYDVANPWIVGALIWMWVIALIALLIRSFPRSQFALLFEAWYEWMFDFFQDILPWERNVWLVKFVTAIFFILFVFNILALVFDPIASVTGYDVLTDEFNLGKIITIATGDIHFNAAIAVVCVLVMLYSQWATKIVTSTWIIGWLQKIWKTIYEYVPIYGKWLVEVERVDKSLPVFLLMFIPVKLFDIAISLFVWALDIIGLWAKILSLAARLFGNMMAWWILSKLLIVGAWSAIAWLFGRIIDVESFPVVVPLIVYLQWLLVALIQAFVFPLLVAIFIKVVQEDEDETLHPVSETVENVMPESYQHI